MRLLLYWATIPDWGGGVIPRRGGVGGGLGLVSLLGCKGGPLLVIAWDDGGPLGTRCMVAGFGGIGGAPEADGESDRCCCCWAFNVRLARWCPLYFQFSYFLIIINISENANTTRTCIVVLKNPILFLEYRWNTLACIASQSGLVSWCHDSSFLVGS